MLDKERLKIVVDGIGAGMMIASVYAVCYK